MTSSEDTALFPDTFISTINRLSLEISKAPAQMRAGTHLSPRAGSSLQFRDFAPYSQGDDLRRIDWNVFARTRHLFVRRFDHPSAVPVSIFVDDSASMRLGQPGRFPTAARLALAVATAAVSSHDPVQMIIGPGARPLRPTADRRGLARMAAELANTLDHPPVQIGLARALDSALPRLTARGRGPLVVISDFFEDRGAAVLSAALRRHSGPLLCLRVSEPHDYNPDFSLDDDLIDCETGKQLTLSTGNRLARYRAAYDEYFGTLLKELSRTACQFLLFETGQGPMEMLSRLFPTGTLKL